MVSSVCWISREFSGFRPVSHYLSNSLESGYDVMLVTCHRFGYQYYLSVSVGLFH